MRTALLLFALLTLVIIGCSDNSQTGSGQGRLVLETFDAPGPDSVDAVLLHVIEVSVNHTENGWSTIAEPDTIINFLDLTNGVMVELADDSVNIGNYTELRLLLADTNWIVIDGDTLDLTTPSGQSSGVKLKADFTVPQDALVRLYIDFDASHSVVIAGDKFNLHPVFHVFADIVSGRVAGMVSDTLGAPIPGAVIDAVGLAYSTSTVSDSTGMYMLILPEGMYDISASAAGYTAADTSYTGIEVIGGMSDLTGLDFVLE